MKPIRVLIADGNPILRYGLHELMSKDDGIQLVGMAENVPSLLDQMHSLKLDLDVVLLDFHLPPTGGLHATQELQRTVLDPPRVILLSDSDDHGKILCDALQSGVDGFLLRSTSYEELGEAIRRVHAGEILVSSRQVSELVKRFQALAREHMLEQTDLSDTELRILEYLACGKTYAEIGDRLFLSERTVKRKVQSAVDKIGANNRTHAVALAIRRGLI